MNAYMYQAALYCEECATAIKHRLDLDGKTPTLPDDERTFDSDDYPKGPYADGGGESDIPAHCDACGLFLRNPLTSDGEQYVREQRIIPADWRDEYAYLWLNLEDPDEFPSLDEI